MRGLVAGLLLMPALVAAQDWSRAADDAAVVAALAGRSVVYDDGTRQSFSASGVTDFLAGTPSQGRWTARGGQYCSQWPPSDQWACYDLDLAGPRLRFIAGDGSITEGRFEE